MLSSSILKTSQGLFSGSRIQSSFAQDSLSLENWPTHFEGTSLHMTDSPRLQLLYPHFIGESASFRASGREVLLRRTRRGTRRLQATETALRNNGFLISHLYKDSENWLCYYAEKENERLHVREQISDGKQTWVSSSLWFWHATLQPKSGPWVAITVITPLH